MSLNCVRGLNHKYPQRLHLIHQGDPHSGPIREQILGWDCILMTSSHCCRCWNTLYIYKVDLQWVWTVCRVSIISTHRDQRLHLLHQEHPLSGPREQILGWDCGIASLWPVATVAGAETLYIYKEDLLWVWTVCGVSIISTHRDSTFYTKNIHSQDPESRY